MFEGARVLLTGLMELETVDVDNPVIRLCDGGFIDWPGRGMFQSFHPEYGTIGGVDIGAAMVGDEATGGQLVLNVVTTEAAILLASAPMQGKALRFWIGEVNPTTGLLIGTPQKEFEGVIDTVSISLGQNDRTVMLEYADAAERLWSIREGNVLTTRFHQTAWPGELGFDFCTGTGTQVPWGVSGPSRGSGLYSGLVGAVFGGGGGSGGYSGNTANV